MQRWKSWTGCACVLMACLSCMASVALAATAPPRPTTEFERILLWPGGSAPGDVVLASAEHIVERSDDPPRPDRYMDRISHPHLTVHRPAHPDGSALLVIPGGGYQRVVLDKEGTALAPFFAEQAGVTLFVLRYRLPGEAHRGARNVALADAQRAMRLIRARAKAEGIDPGRVGVMGFSAGGHVAAMLATRYASCIYPAVDGEDARSARPDLQLLVYPVISMAQDIAHPGSRLRLLGPQPREQDVHAASAQHGVGSGTPPAFVMHAQDDTVVPVANSLAYADALVRAGVSTELHIFPKGGHGFGVRETDGQTVAVWPTLATEWMRWQYAHRVTPRGEESQQCLP